MPKFLISLQVMTIAVVGAVLLWPNDAYAWGPLAHLDFSSAALGQLGAASGALRVLLTKCASDFLYGSLAADIIVGKNLARYAVHCHNWKVGWKVFEQAKGEPQQAFALGMLSHLAADTIAHNYYVPYKTVEGFPTRGTGHAYWELRYDQRLDPSLWQVARKISTESFRRHDEFLEQALVDSCVIPFGVSKKLFNQLLFAARMKKYQGMSAMVARDAAHLPLTPDEVDDTRRLAVEQIVGMIAEGESSRANGADPTGGRNLHLAVKLRQQLREATRKNEIAESDAALVLAETRPAFREAIHGKLVLPEVPLRSGISSAARELVHGLSAEAEALTEEQLEEEAIAREEEEHGDEPNASAA